MAKPSWITLSKSSGTGGGSVNVTAAENTGNAPRSGVLTIRTSSGLTKTVSVSQEYSPKMTINLHTTLTFSPSGNKDHTRFDFYILYEYGGIESWQEFCSVNYEGNGYNESVPVEGTYEIETSDNVVFKGFIVGAQVTRVTTGSKFGSLTNRVSFNYQGYTYRFDTMSKPLEWSGTWADNIRYPFSNSATISCAAGRSATIDIDSASGLTNGFSVQ